MDNQLALFVCDDYIQAAYLDGENITRPVPSGKDGGRYYLYFKRDSATGRPDYGHEYMMAYRNGQPDTDGDVLQRLDSGDRRPSEALDVVINDIISKCPALGGSVVVFSDNLGDGARSGVGESLSRCGVKPGPQESFASVVVRHFAKRRGLLCNNRRMAVLETLGGSLNMYVVAITGSDCSIQFTRHVEGIGVEPLTRAIAEKIVNTVNMNSHIIAPGDAQALSLEIKRHYALSAKVIAYFNGNPNKDAIKLSTNFALAPDKKFPVGLSREELYREANNYSRQYQAAFENELMASNGCRVIDLENIILVGGVFENPTILKGFQEIGGAKVVTFGDDFSVFMDSIAVAPTEVSVTPASQQPAEPESDSEGTIFQMVQPVTSPQPVTPPQQPTPPQPPTAQDDGMKEVATLYIDTLKPGTMVYVDTFDPTPGKGSAYQELEYQGQGVFLVIGSSRSLAPGDIAKPLSKVLQGGVQLDFMITRDGRSLGRFRTRVVKRIRIKS